MGHNATVLRVTLEKNVFRVPSASKTVRGTNRSKHHNSHCFSLCVGISHDARTANWTDAKEQKMMNGGGDGERQKSGTECHCTALHCIVIEDGGGKRGRMKGRRSARWRDAVFIITKVGNEIGRERERENQASLSPPPKPRRY